MTSPSASGQRSPCGESERRYRHIFQTAGVSIWEEDFSQVKAAIDDLKAQGVPELPPISRRAPGICPASHLNGEDP